MKGIFNEYLLEHNVEHTTIIKNVDDHKSLSHINGISKYVRNNIIKNYTETKNI